MGTWSITPDIGIGADGSVTFPENTDLTEKTYTITYTDGNMVCSKTVKQKGRDCVCSINVNGETIGNNAGTYTFARYTADTCVEITVTKNADWITAIGVDTSNQKITGTVTANDAVTGRTATINVNGKAGDETCSKSFDLAQEGKGCDCHTFSVTPSTVRKDAGTYTFATYTADSCITEITATKTADWITSIGVDTTNQTITGTVTDNGDANGRTTTINVSGRASSTPCPLSFDLTQEGQGCSCDDLTIPVTSVEFEWNEKNAPAPKYICDVDIDDCVTNIVCSVSNNQYFVADIVNKKLYASPQEHNTSYGSRTATLTVTYNADCSKTVELTQKCWTCGDLNIEMLIEQNQPFGTVIDDDKKWIDIAIVGLTEGTMQDSDYDALYLEYDRFGFSEHKWVRVDNGKKLQLKLTDVEQARWSYIDIGVNRNQGGCVEYNIRRICPCAMDDCFSSMIDRYGRSVDIDHVLPADPWLLVNGQTTTTIDNVTYEVMFNTGDGLHVPASALTIEGVPVSSESVFKTDEYGYEVLTKEGWYAEHEENGKTILIGYNPTPGVGAPYGQIRYYMPNNFTDETQDFHINYTVKDGNIMLDGEYDGMIPCSSFVVHIAQAPNGSHFQNSGERDEYHQVKRYLVPLSTQGSGSYPGQPNYNCGIIQLGGPNELNPNIPPPFISKIPDGYDIDSNDDGSCRD